MPTLHTVTEKTKKVSRWAAITIAAIIFLFFAFRFGSALKEQFFPTPPPEPTASFGKLPKISFPQNATDKKLSYTLNTISGTLPNFPDRVSIYPIKKPQPNLLNLKKAQQKAENSGFEDQPQALSDTIYVWSQTQPPFKKLTIDTISFNFSISSNYLTNPDSILNNDALPNLASAQTAATSFLTRLSLFPNDIDVAKTKTTLLTVENQSIIEASSPSTARLIRVDFFQKDIDGLPIFYPRPPQSTMYLILAGGIFDEEVVEAKFNHFVVDYTSGTYPVKTAELAFKELQGQKAYIASYFGEENTIRIKNVLLGYYMSETDTEYLMPIVIFEGDNGFFAYISAVTDEWIETASVQQ